MEIITLCGKEILPFLDSIAELRINIFSEWPYLYDGDLKSERNYLKGYGESQDSIAIVTKEEKQVIGIAIGLPVKKSMQQVQKIFNEKQISMEKCYYLGDLILLKEYRKKKIGLKMIQNFERAVKDLKSCEQIYLCEILREENDPKKPNTYKSLDFFWENLGYKIVPNWQIYLSWLGIGDTEKKSHLIRFRKKVI